MDEKQFKELSAKLDKNPEIFWKGGGIRRYQNQILAFSCQPKTLSSDFRGLVLDWNLDHPIQLPDGSSWRVLKRMGQGISTAALKNNALQIRFRQGGGRASLYLDGRFGTKPWIFLGLTLTAFIISAFGIVRVISRYMKKMEEENKNKNNQDY